MAKLLILFLAIISFSPAVIGEEFVREGWPGEGTPRLAAKSDELVLHKTPDLTSESRRLKYKTGWLIVWDQSKVITKKSAIWTVKREINKGSCGTLSPGVKVEFLQFEAEGWGAFKVGDKICSLKATRDRDFDKAGEWPEVEWWVRVLDNTKAAVGWLLVDAQQVNLLPRKF
ncbi:MAG: hypothetical protein JSU67_05855 [Gammaproteobacteria bacterium]|nr:MAG: hypothetical protein JSU67_05855 [Gammaproteobacteria bacterium]